MIQLKKNFKLSEKFFKLQFKTVNEFDIKFFFANLILFIKIKQGSTDPNILISKKKKYEFSFFGFEVFCTVVDMFLI